MKIPRSTVSQTMTLPADIDAGHAIAQHLVFQAGNLLSVFRSEETVGPTHHLLTRVVEPARLIGSELLRFMRREPPLFPLMNEFSALNNPLTLGDLSGSCAHEVAVLFAQRVLVEVGAGIAGEGTRDAGLIPWSSYVGGITSHPFAAYRYGCEVYINSSDLPPLVVAPVWGGERDPESVLRCSWPRVRDYLRSINVPEPREIAARLRAEAYAAAAARTARPTPPRVAFDDDTLTVIIDGRRTRIDRPTPYILFKTIALARPGVVSSDDLSDTRGLRGKNIPRELDRLPGGLRGHIQSAKGSGYWFQLDDGKLS